MKKETSTKVVKKKASSKRTVSGVFAARHAATGRRASVEDVYISGEGIEVRVRGKTGEAVRVYRDPRKVKDLSVAKIVEAATPVTLKRIEEENRATQEYLIALSAGMDTDNIPLPRYVPIRIYLEDGENCKNVIKAVEALASELNFSMVNEYEPIIGSWLQKLIGRTNDAIPKDELLERLAKAERAIELAKINKVQSEIDNNLGAAVSAVIESLKGEENAAIQLSSLLIIKRTDERGGSTIATRTLTQKELVYLERNPSLVNDPVAILGVLESLRKTEDISIPRLKDER